MLDYAAARGTTKKPVGRPLPSLRASPRSGRPQREETELVELV